MATKQKENKISLLEYAENHNPKLTRRGHKMTYSYLYRLIREDKNGKREEGVGPTRPLWFKYEFDKEHKDRIWIKL